MPATTTILAARVLDWFADEGLQVEEDFKQEDGWGYRYFLLGDERSGGPPQAGGQVVAERALRAMATRRFAVTRKRRTR